MRALTLAALFAVSVGCAHAPLPQLEAAGPGAVFPTIEAAAIDAVTFAHLQQRADDGSLRRVRAGTVTRVDGGFTYREVRVASRLQPGRVDFPLGPDDVAHFRTYTWANHTNDALLLNRVRERPSRDCQRLVDRIDPLHRPAFILTPSLAVRVYRGKDLGLEQVASLRAPQQPALLARQSDDR
jgi:hypothetical protein